MMSPAVTLRPWRDSDFEPYAEMNADSEVMRYYLAPLTRAESATSFEEMRAAIDDQGWGLWAVDIDGAFAGLTGLSVPTFTASFTPCVEIGWRLRKEFWGRGLAYAAARQAESFAFESLKVPELVAFTTEGNLRSRALMVRLGFSRKPGDDFLHPRVPAEHPLRPHVLYRKRSGAV